MTKLLCEASTEAPVKVGNRWRGVLARPGQGTSGFYSEDVLREYGPQALAPGAKAFIDHKEDRSPKDMIGVYPDGAYYEDGVGLVGELDVFPHWKDFVEAVGPHAGLSIYMVGEADADGNVTALHPDRMNGVDLVSYPGLEGSGLVEKLYESAHKASVVVAEKDSTAPAGAGKTEREKITMDEAVKLYLESILTPLAAKLEAIEGKIDAVTTLAESVRDAQPERVEAVDAAGELATAVAEAHLGEKAVKRVLESVKTGTSVEDAVKHEKDIRDEILAEAGTRLQEGVFGGSADDDADYHMTGVRF